MGLHKISKKQFFGQLNQIQSRFFLATSSSEEKNGLLCHGKKLTRPLNEEGSPLDILNSAVMAQTLWHFLSNPDAMWVHLLSQKYISHGPITDCEHKPKTPPSGNLL
eukprot:TRINITY_DN96123_c0_g1_i1.p1 TRINITY_DN96123_c0_g1~~TRINITY_DN96123_c0_g1_i1.p1  ORF type:complete len:107 (-),score=13.39 TRINITY_DN96123_c0_g1_i1:13-333(-)